MGLVDEMTLCKDNFRNGANKQTAFYIPMTIISSPSFRIYFITNMAHTLIHNLGIVKEQDKLNNKIVRHMNGRPLSRLIEQDEWNARRLTNKQPFHLLTDYYTQFVSP